MLSRINFTCTCRTRRKKIKVTQTNVCCFCTFPYKQGANRPGRHVELVQSSRDQEVGVRESRTDYSAVCVWSDQSIPSGRGDGWMPVCTSSTLHHSPRPSVIEKLACLCCLGICPFIMQLQNRKTNSGNRPPNVINFAEARGGEG